MDPPPIDFTDRARARERSLFALYQVIEQGLEGTAMPGFSHLPPEDRWVLAFHVGQFAYPSSAAQAGERIWQTDPEARSLVPDLAALVRLTERKGVVSGKGGSGSVRVVDVVLQKKTNEPGERQ